MKRLRQILHGLVWWARFGPAARHFVAPPADDPAWTQDDAATLAHWWATTTGKRLWAMVRAQEARNNHGAVLGKSGTRDYACGAAAGFRAGTAFVLTLSQPLPANEQGSRSADESADASELRQRLSP